MTVVASLALDGEISMTRLSGALRELVFEESFVLDIEMRPYLLLMRIDFVLTPRHPAYRIPDPGNRECFRKGALQVRGFTRVTWSATGYRPAIDADGEQDWGNFDMLELRQGRTRLCGDWGEIDAEGGELIIDFEGR